MQSLALFTMFIFCMAAVQSAEPDEAVQFDPTEEHKLSTLLLRQSNGETIRKKRQCCGGGGGYGGYPINRGYPGFAGGGAGYGYGSGASGIYGNGVYPNTGVVGGGLYGNGLYGNGAYGNGLYGNGLYGNGAYGDPRLYGTTGVGVGQNLGSFGPGGFGQGGFGQGGFGGVGTGVPFGAACVGGQLACINSSCGQGFVCYGNCCVPGGNNIG
uniref:Uncharacterized protein n=1 Tax=Plectus sambesii TaxID=2011161 RepID=A0A914X2R2_9BILA